MDREEREKDGEEGGGEEKEKEEEGEKREEEERRRTRGRKTRCGAVVKMLTHSFPETLTKYPQGVFPFQHEPTMATSQMNE